MVPTGKIKRGDGFSASGHSLEEFGQCIATRNTGIPEKKTSTKTIPYMSGFYDFSKVYGAIAYESREVTYSIELIGDDREDLQRQKSELSEWLLGIHDEPIYDGDIPGWHFVGSCESIDWEEGDEGESGTLEVTFLCQPFMEADEESTQTLEVGTATVHIEGQPVNVTAKTESGAASIIIGTITQSVSTTPMRLTAQLMPGDNSVTVSGAAVTLTWHEQRI